MGQVEYTGSGTSPQEGSPCRITGDQPEWWDRKGWSAYFREGRGLLAPSQSRLAWEVLKLEGEGFTPDEADRMARELVRVPTGSETGRGLALSTTVHISPLPLGKSFGDRLGDSLSFDGAGPAPRQLSGANSNQLPSLCGITWAKNGNLAHLVLPTTESKSKGVEPVQHALRGNIYGYSPQSRSRFMHRLNMVDREQVPAEQVHFTTLTYHNEWGNSWEVWKGHLDTLFKRHERRWGAIPIFWKLEFQKRGAPHFHLLSLWLSAAPDLEEYRGWLVRAWAEVVAGPGNEVDPLHAVYGVMVEAAKSWAGVNGYVAKYLAKGAMMAPDAETGEYAKTGRWWGIVRKKLLPVHLNSCRLSEAEALATRRVLHKYALVCAKEVREKERAKCADLVANGFEPSVEYDAAVRLVQRAKKRRRAKVANVTVFALEATVERLVRWVKQEKRKAGNECDWGYVGFRSEGGLQC